MKTIAFIGLGNMGLPMALNLVRAGYQVTGFDVSVAGCEAAQKQGVPIAATALAAAQQADIIITMLPKGEHVLSVYQQICPQLAGEKLLIDCSTIDVASARKAHELAASHHHLSVDAPVSGGTAGAQQATLTFMCGGSAGAFAQAQPVLQAMGKKIVHCGADGTGQSAKICNNMVLGVTMIAVSEAFALGEKLGLSHQALFDVASTSSGQCWALTSYCPVPGPVASSPANRDYQPGFAAALMLKDLHLAQDAAQQADVATPLGANAASLYQSFVDSGHAGLDFSAIIEMLRGRSHG